MTNMIQYVPLDALKELFDYHQVATNKINTIKLLRSITGEGLKETKDFLEQVVLPSLESQGSFLSPSFAGVGEPEQPNPHTGVPLSPPMFLVGHSYKQRDKNTVLILGVSNFNTTGETVYSMDPTGAVVHRYNRRDFGRVTGTDHNVPDPRNLEIP
jgi:Ribosomal protein L7/L12 C-terminal domain